MSGKTPDFIDLMREDLSSYTHPEPGLTPYNAYLLPAVERLLGPPGGRRLFEIGFGNGAVAAHLASRGFEVAGIEPSHQGLALTRSSYPALTGLQHGTIYEDLRARFGAFQAVVSLEVIEHLYFPRRLAQAAYALLEPGGLLVVSTIYHGYLKNIATAVLGRFDLKMNPLWDHGHIKFFSPRTLSRLFREAGFENVTVKRPDLIPQFARSMVVCGQKPG
ncbi:MAG: class I SAM-dependent methyltransferase [Rhodospirillaceae bacterium]|nr:class I SAM-dependent methyltransferase [Rhodospirillaceae bacterium]